jgi:hypothetical protein
MIIDKDKYYIYKNLSNPNCNNCILTGGRPPKKDEATLAYTIIFKTVFPHRKSCLGWNKCYFPKGAIDYLQEATDADLFAVSL